jgi:hypothetical protein
MKRFFYIRVIDMPWEDNRKRWLGEYAQYVFSRSGAHLFDQIEDWMMDDEYIIEELPECQQMRLNNAPALLDLSLYEKPCNLTPWGGGAPATPTIPGMKP